MELSNLVAITHCFKPLHYQVLEQALPKWIETFPSSRFVVGYLEERAPSGWVDQVGGLNQVTLSPVSAKTYGGAYDELVSGHQPCDAILVFAPYVVPKGWFHGSLQAWLDQYSLIGKFKPPRVLIAEKIYLPLVSPVIVEIGRLSLDCVVMRSDLLPFITFQYQEWSFGTVLVRARPGATALFKALSVGCSVLTLGHGCNPVRYLIKKE